MNNSTDKNILQLATIPLDGAEFWEMALSPGDAAFTITTGSYLKVYPLSDWELWWLNCKHSINAPYTIAPTYWNVPDPIAFSEDSRFLALSAGSAEQDYNFVLIYDLSNNHIHWFFRFGDENCRSLKFYDGSLFIMTLSTQEIISVNLTSGETARHSYEKLPFDPDLLINDNSMGYGYFRRQNDEDKSIFDRWGSYGLGIDKSAVKSVIENSACNFIALRYENEVCLYTMDTFKPLVPKFVASFI